MSVAGALKRFILGGADAAASKEASLTRLLKMGAEEGLDEDMLKAHHTYHSDAAGSGLTKGSLEKIIEDVSGGVPVGMGGARATGEGNILTKAFNISDGGIPGAAMMMGGLVGGTAAGATDSNIGEGAVIGALFGGGVKALGTGIAKDIEKKFIGDLLGDSAGKFSVGPGRKPIMSDDLMNMKVKDIPDEYLSLSSNKAMGYTADDAAPMTFGELKKQSTGDAADFTLGSMSAQGAPIRTAGNELFPEIAQGASIRQQQLTAISNMDDAALKQAGSGAEFKRDFLMGQSKMNVGQMTRMSGFIGSALTGMAFSSKQRDYRTGFNKRRGNRV